MTTQGSSNHVLWYRYPAKDWNKQILHLGNGFIGASFYGDVAEERISISEKSFWTGGPGDENKPQYGIKQGGRLVVSEIRKRILRGDITAADALTVEHFMGDYAHFGGLSTVGHLSIKMTGQDDAIANYERSLNLQTSTGSVRYRAGNTEFTRQIFCSYPDRVLVIRLTASKPGALNFVLKQELAHTKRNPVLRASAQGNGLDIDGNIDDNNRPYSVRIRVAAATGQVAVVKDTLVITAAQDVTIIYAISTNYKLLPPFYRGDDPKPSTLKYVEGALRKGITTLYKRHVADVRRLYDASRLEITPAHKAREVLPTNERWNLYARGDYQDVGLKVLAFNMGRYLLIASSRPGSLPAGLQGAWNENYNAQWSGNYQVNINIPLIYMSGACVGLASCNEPFMDWIAGQVIPGRAVAQEYYGTSGWVTNATGNIWGYASSGLDLEWGLFPSGAAWLCRHLWEQYAFTNNKRFLRQSALPIMLEASHFWLDNLQDYHGHLVAIPAVSAEQRSPNGYLEIPYQDIVFVRDLFGNTLKAAKICGSKNPLIKRIEAAILKLQPLLIGRLGQLQEWVPDIDDPMCRHRHFMHLSALHPCDAINPRTDQALAEAVRVSMNMRGDGSNKERLDPHYTNQWPCTCQHVGSPKDAHIGGNWSRSWKVWLWARLFDGDRADKILGELIGEAGMENMCQYQQVPPDRTPMQLDGAITTPGCITEMLLQSQHEEIEILPSLPSSWANGSVQGVCVRGGVVADIAWKKGRLDTLHLHCPNAGIIRLRYGTQSTSITVTTKTSLWFDGGLTLTDAP